VTTGGGSGVPDHERAETYLRLQAEAELRTALGFPRYKQPRPGRLRGRARSTVHALRRGYRQVAATLNFSRARAGSGYARSRTDRLVVRRARRLVRAGRWARHPRLSFAPLAAYRFRRPARWLRQRFGRQYQPVPARACLDRLTTLAGALASAGVVDEEIAESVLVDVRTALAARSLVDESELLGGPVRRPRPGPRAHLAQAGPLRAVPVGATADYQEAGGTGRAYLGAMVVGPDSADLTVTARFSAAAPEPIAMRAQHPIMAALPECTATDDRGGSYHADFSGGGGTEQWDGILHFRPAPPAGVRWLDVTLPGADPIRVDLTIPPAAMATTATSLPAEGAADRYLDSLTTHLLLAGWHQDLASDADPDAVTAAAGLLAAGVLVADSPAIRRLAAAAQRTGLDLPTPLAGVRPARLPADWLSLLARRDSDDGPTGFIPIAAVLPGLDGACCVIAELRSEPRSAMMLVRARGWPMHRHFRLLPGEPFRWTARDDLGGWHMTADEGGSRSSDGRADLRLRLQPAIHPRARTLEIVLTGKTGEVSVTVPLDWREGI
jgi:hypothetical protein